MSDAGMTDLEAEAWWIVRDAARACLQLTDDEPGHLMEREEFCHAFHQIQGLLALRPTMRAMIEDVTP